MRLMKSMMTRLSTVSSSNSPKEFTVSVFVLNALLSATYWNSCQCEWSLTNDVRSIFYPITPNVRTFPPVSRSL